MKKTLITGLLLLGTLWRASAALYYQGNPGIDTTGGTAVGTVSSPTILDGNPVGTWNTMELSGLGGTLTSLTVTLNVSGGVNSGLYAYLVHDGVNAVLLNRPGVSGATPLGDLGSGFITSYTTIDANSGVSPFASASSITGSGPTTSLVSTFGSASLNGSWTLFLADMVNGGGNATLNGWSLDITPVPEPVTLALGSFAAMWLTLAGLKWAWATKLGRQSIK
jgi:hypothetical protein